MDGDVTTSPAVDENEPTASGRGGKLIIVPRTRSGRRPRDYGGDSGLERGAVAKDDPSIEGPFCKSIEDRGNRYTTNFWKRGDIAILRRFSNVAFLTFIAILLKFL